VTASYGEMSAEAAACPVTRSAQVDAAKEDNHSDISPKLLMKTDDG